MSYPDSDGQDHKKRLYDPVRHGMSYPDSDTDKIIKSSIERDPVR